MSDTPATPPQQNPNPVSAIRAEVKTSIATRNGDVKARIINTLVEEALAKRTELVSKAITAFDQISSELKKINPDVIIQDEAGKPTYQGYTPAMAQKRRAATEQLTKITEALSLAIDSGDYSKLTDFMGKYKPSGGAANPNAPSEKPEHSGLS